MSNPVPGGFSFRPWVRDTRQSRGLAGPLCARVERGEQRLGQAGGGGGVRIKRNLGAVISTNTRKANMTQVIQHTDWGWGLPRGTKRSSETCRSAITVFTSLYRLGVWDWQTCVPVQLGINTSLSWRWHKKNKILELFITFMLLQIVVLVRTNSI